MCNQSNVLLYFFLSFFFGQPLCGRHCCRCHLNLARPSDEWVRPPRPLLAGHPFRSALLLPLSLKLFQDGAAALTCGRGPCFVVGLLFHKVIDMVLLAACIPKQGKAELRKVFEVKWPQGLDTRQGVGVYVYKVGLSGWPSHNQQKPCLLFTLLHCNQTIFFMSYRPGCYWNNGGVIDYPDGFSIFDSADMRLFLFFAFSLQNWSCLWPA